MSRLLMLCVALGLGLSFAGCNATVTSESVEVQATPAKGNIKVALQDVVKFGNQGSAMSDIDSQIEMLATEDAALAETLKADIAELKGLTNDAKVKAKAEEILKKLQ